MGTAAGDTSAQAGDAFRKSEEQFRTLVESSPNALLLVDQDGTILLANRQAEAIFGYTREELLGRPVDTLVPDRFRERHPSHRAQFMSDPRQRPMGAGRDLWGLRKDGSELQVEIGLTPIQMDGSLFVLATITDITERKRREEELRRSRDELEVKVKERTSELASTVESLREEVSERIAAEEEMRESEGRLRVAQQAARIGAFDWDVRTGVDTWTPELEAMYGLQPGEFGESEAAWEQLIHPEDRQAAVGLCDRAFETGEPIEGEWRVVWPDGSVHWIFGRFQAFRDEAGAPIRLTGVNIDITDRKRAEQELKQSRDELEMKVRERTSELAATVETLKKEVGERIAAEAAAREGESRLRLAQQAARIGAFDWDVRADVNTWTPELEAMYGLQPGGFGKTETAWEQLVHPEDRQAVIAMVHRAFETGKPGEGEWRVVWPDGSTHWIFGLFQAFRDEADAPIRLTGVNIDITERKRIEEALRESETRLRLAHQAARIGAFDWDVRANVNTWTPELEAMYGLRPGEFGKSQTAWEQLVHPEDRQAAIAVVNRAFQTGEPDEAEWRVVWPDGSVHWIFGRFQAFRDGAGAPIRLTGVNIDVSERKRIEQELKQSRDELEVKVTERTAQLADTIETLKKEVAERIAAEAAARRSEARLRTLFESDMVGIMYWNQDGRITNANGRYLEMIGYSREDLEAGRINWIRMTPPEYLAQDEAAVQEIHVRGATTPLEKEYIRKDGTRIPIILGAAALDEARSEGVGFALDISNRKQAEEALRESEEKFRVVAENARAIFGIIQGNHFIYANAYLAEISGYSVAEILKMEFAQLVHPSFRQMMVDRARRRMMGEVLPSHYEFILLGRNGEEHWLDFSVGRIMLRGQPALIGAAFDITERKRAEAALRESEERYRSLFEKMDEGFCIVEMIYDPQGKPVDYRFVEINPAFERHTGLQNALGKTIRELVPGHEAHWFEIYGRVARTGEAIRFENVAQAMHRSYDVFAFRLGEEAHPRVGILFEDITARKAAEARLAQTVAELARSNQDLEQFANVASHDLQEPLRVVTGFLTLLRNRYGPQLDDKAREYIGLTVDGADRMGALIRDLLAYSRVGREGEGFAETDMATVLASAIGNLHAGIEEARGIITHDPLPAVKVDRTLMSQLLQNLIGNAVKYCAADVQPRIHVGARREERGWVFSVRDNGIGIKAEDRDRIFMIFQRLHTRQQYPGTGVGLAICKRIIDHHCGRIWVESEVGKGSTFYFTIPDRD